MPRGVVKSLVLFLLSSNPCVLSPPPSNPHPLRIPASNPYPCFSTPLDSPFGLPRSTQKSPPSNPTFLGSQFRCFSKSSLLYLQGTKLNLKLTAIEPEQISALPRRGGRRAVLGSGRCTKTTHRTCSCMDLSWRKGATADWIQVRQSEGLSVRENVHG